MKKILNLLMALSLSAAAPVAMAEGPLDKGNFSANVAYTTDYVFRGISLLDDGAAVSGGFDWGTVVSIWVPGQVQYHQLLANL